MAVADWVKIEGDYRAGVKSLRSIAREHGISEAYIRKRAKAEDWSRDLADRIRATAKMQLAVKRAPSASDKRLARQREQAIIEAAAASQVEVIERHRKQVAQLSRDRDKLAKHLGALVEDAADLGACVVVLEKLTGITERIIKMDRQAYGLDDERTESGAQQILKIERVIVDIANPNGARFSPAA